jgi:hypothetical protein
MKDPTLHLRMRRFFSVKSLPETSSGRAGGIRTHDPLPPRQVRYQAALQPEHNERGRRKPELADVGKQRISFIAHFLFFTR